MPKAARFVQSFRRNTGLCQTDGRTRTVKIVELKRILYELLVRQVYL